MDTWDTEERRLLRETVRRFSEREVLPHLAEWETAGSVVRNGSPRCSESWWPKKSKSTQVSVLRPSRQPSTPP